MADALDVAKFNLESVRAYAEMRIDYLEAIADYNYRMMEVLEKQVKVETDQEKLLQLKAAYQEYKSTIREIKKRSMKAQREEQKIVKATVKANRLKWGENLNANLVTSSWQGFQVFLNSLHSKDSLKVFKVRVSEKERKAENFSRNRFPNAQCEDAPATIKAALSLFQWCRKKQYLPRMGSHAMDTLLEIFETVDTASQKRLEELTSQLMETRKQLLQLRKEHWKNVNALHD